MAAATAAAATAPPTTSPPSSPLHRKPLPLHDGSPEPSHRSEAAKPLPIIPISADAPRLRQPPVSPVRVNFQPENWAQPSNANIEHSYGYTLSVDDAAAASPSALETATATTTTTGASTASTAERDLPRTPGAPTPPPHTPQSQNAPTFAAEPQQMESRPLPVLSVRPVTGAEEASASASVSASSPAHGGVNVDIPYTTLDFGFTNHLRQGGTATPDTDGASTSDAAAAASASGTSSGETRPRRETNATVRTSQQSGPQQVSAESSATTSSSSVSGPNEAFESSADQSPESSLEDGTPGGSQSVPQLQYHHQNFLPHSASMTAIAQQDQYNDLRSSSNPDLLGNANAHAHANRHLTPTAHPFRRSSLPRPQSAYSVYSDLGPRGRSPNFYSGSHMRAPSTHSRKSPDVRPASYADMLNVPYPQPAPAPIALDNARLRNAVGTNASLLSTQKTLEMYRQNVKKTNDMSIQYSFAVFLISTAQEQGLSYDESSKRKNSPKPVRDLESPYVETATATPLELVREARSILQRLSNAGYPFAQYYLADGYASGLFSKGKEDYNAAFPLFVLAAKRGHAESAYRTALCYEFGWGCRKDPTKAIQYLRTAAAKHHPGAMTRLGKACLSGDLGEKRYREGIKWLKLATESADAIYNGAPYQLGCLYETGYGDDIFKDESYAAELFTQAAELGHPDANFRMGDAYEHGKLNCPRDPALSVHFYTGAAERGHAAAMMGLCAWYMVGAEPLLEKDEEEAYEWARRSAELGYVKAEYAVGYFTEMGIGCRRDILEANVWYVKAADAGDERAKQRMAAIRAAVSGGTPMEVGPPRNGGSKIKKHGSGGKDDNCVVM
ncbi:Tetratricopeptide-like helical [Niveomyces insectorum RCEF 264]|uniref:Tetratricopeptide-like helical n=1 Tax=Niveomyces insectorum RCEF 264 TaxID=1081102 RepID=A0A167X2L2_9HYPO|nr:Tetratricopeptide-like helical [Niveomyces insectorum RCEF 264]